MRVIINEPHINKMAARGRRIMTVGLVMLVFSVFLSLNVNTVLPAYGVLVVALIVVNLGLAFGGKWMQRPRADQLLDKVLKGLEGSSRLYALVLPADHVILSPAGLFTLTLKSQDGQITCRGDTWRRRWSLTSMFRSLFGARLGNPTRQARKDAAALKKWLSSRLPDVEVPIQPVIVFAHPRADLKLEEPSVPVVRLDELKSYLREATRSSVLDRATLQSLTELFDQQAG